MARHINAPSEAPGAAPGAPIRDYQGNRTKQINPSKSTQNTNMTNNLIF